MKEQPYRRQSSHASRPYGSTLSTTGEGSSRLQKPELRPSRAVKKRPVLSDPDDENTLCPWLENLPKDMKFNGAEHKLHHEIVAYLTYMEATPEESNARRRAAVEIRRVVQSRFRNAQVNVFGSTVTGLSLPTSDIDMVLMIPHVAAADVKRTLFHLSRKFKESRIASDVFVNHRAHTPIIILTTSEEYGSFSVDIGINNTVGTQAIDVIKGYVIRMPALRPLVLLLKGFLRQRKLNDASKGGLGSYALICLCIHFLQVNPSQRPLEWIENPMESESLGFLFSDFLHYYGFTFPYTTSYISITTSPGETLPKPEESDFLSIRCLINPDNEIAKSMGKMKAFVQSFKDAYATLLQLTHLEENLLGTVIRVNRKFVARRAFLSALRAHNPPETYPLLHSLPPHPTPLPPLTNFPSRRPYHPLPPRPFPPHAYTFYSHPRP